MKYDENRRGINMTLNDIIQDDGCRLLNSRFIAAKEIQFGNDEQIIARRYIVQIMESAIEAILRSEPGFLQIESKKTETGDREYTGRAILIKESRLAELLKYEKEVMQPGGKWDDEKDEWGHRAICAAAEAALERSKE